jgi:hypothetical protein
MRKAEFVQEPVLLARHTADSEFIGPTTCSLGGNKVLMIVAGGRPPVAFDADEPVQTKVRKFISSDSGRTWQFSGMFEIEQIDGQPAAVSTILRLHDGRLAFLCCQGIPRNHNGAFYTLRISKDDGQHIQETNEW